MRCVGHFSFALLLGGACAVTFSCTDGAAFRRDLEKICQLDAKDLGTALPELRERLETRDARNYVDTIATYGSTGPLKALAAERGIAHCPFAESGPPPTVD